MRSDSPFCWLENGKATGVSFSHFFCKEVQNAMLQGTNISRKKKPMLRKSLSKACLSHKIHVWYIYLHLLYGIFTYIYHKNQLNVGKYTIHGIPMSLRTTRPLPHQFPDFPRFDSSLKAHFTKHRRFRCGAHEIKRP